MRIIDADALHECFNACFNSGYEKFDADGIREMIDEAPTIEAQPVVHGHWIDEGDYITTAYGSIKVRRCSVCEREITIDDWDDYCPCCGAKMDGKEV